MIFKLCSITLLSIALINCNVGADLKGAEKMKTVDYVDLKRYMGDWYVIANIPTIIEKNATNAV